MGKKYDIVVNLLDFTADFIASPIEPPSSPTPRMLKRPGCMGPIITSARGRCQVRCLTSVLGWLDRIPTTV